MSQQINLYAARLRPRREVLSGRRLGVALGLVLSWLVVQGWLAHAEAERSAAELGVLRSEVAARQATLVAVGKSLAERRVSAGLQAQIDGAKSLLANRQAVMALLDSGQLGNGTGFSAVMSGFSRQASSELWLTGFSVSLGGQEIEIRGRLLDSSKLPAYVQRLSAEPVFRGRRFAALDMRSVDPGETGTAADAAPAALPRYTDFVLRSANGGESAAGGKK